MPKIGLSRPYVAEYVNSGGVISYRNGMRFGRAVELSIDVENSDPNTFYADNGPAESMAGKFTGGTLTMTTAELEPEVSRFILGIKTSAMTLDGESIVENIYDEEAKARDLGFGIIIKKFVNGREFWNAIVLKKVAFNTPGDDVTTQGEEVEWQTAETEATIMRDNSTPAQWKRTAENLPTEALADKYIRTKLGMDVVEIASLAVTSEAGTTEGTTKLTIAPALVSGNKYWYRTGASLTIPYFDQTVDEDSGYLEWDGEADITAPEGYQILVVETDAGNSAKKAGLGVVVTTPEG